MKKSNFLFGFFLFNLLFLKDNKLIAADKSSDGYLHSRVEILEQKIKLLQQEQELANSKLEEYAKNVNATPSDQQNYRQNSDDIKFHGSNEDDIKFIESNSKVEEVKDDLQAVQIEKVIDHNDLADLYNNAVEQIRLKNAESSNLMLKKIIAVNIDDNSDGDSREIIANSHYLIGELSLKAKNYEQASNHFLSAYNLFVKNDNKNIQGANSLYQLAKSLHMMDKKEGACNSLKKIVVEFKKLPENLKNKIDIEATTLHCK